MANALTDFIRKRDFLVCMDSDGCVMDTVRIKHCSVFCPELIRVFGLEAHTDFITTAWEEINLNSITRGISRFESAVLIFDRLKNRGIDVPGSEDIAAWVSTASELSTASLQQEVLRSGSLALRKLQEWNNACNRRIQALEPTFEPFPGVEESLRQLHAAQTAELDTIRLVRSPACRIVWMSGALELHSFLDMEPSIRMLERSQAEAVVFLGKVGVGLSAERLAAGQFAPYDRAFLVLDDEDAFDGDVTVLPETTCAAVCFRGSHPEAPAQYARLMDYLRAHALAPADFSREITMIDYGLTSDPEKFVTEIRIPVRAAE